VIQAVRYAWLHLEGLLYLIAGLHLTGMPTHACFVLFIQLPSNERARIGCISVKEIYRMFAD
jgi:hypothetical protein